MHVYRWIFPAKEVDWKVAAIEAVDQNMCGPDTSRHLKVTKGPKIGCRKSPKAGLGSRGKVAEREMPGGGSGDSSK